MRKNKIKALSLFANVGIGETYLIEEGIDVVLANEIEEKRVKFYKHLYPDTEIIQGDISQNKILEEIIKKSLNKEINLIMATPPCQGMSTAGKKNKDDKRNYLIKYAVHAIKEIKPNYVFFENVPEQFKTEIMCGNETKLILDYLKDELMEIYEFGVAEKVNMADYGVPQSRERAIILLTKKTKKNIWKLPIKENKIITMEDVIGELPILDPLIYDIPYEEQIKIFPNYEKRKKVAEKISKWHIPPKHVYRQVYALMHTPTGKSAFENIDKYKPKKIDGSFVRGYKNTYKRQEWDRPAFTITRYTRTIGSQNNVHPGRYLKKNKNGINIYSDARVLTLYEIIKLMTLPDNWNIPKWASESFIREVIGEGIPPLFMKKIFNKIPD